MQKSHEYVACILYFNKDISMQPEIHILIHLHLHVYVDMHEESAMHSRRWGYADETPDITFSITQRLSLLDLSIPPCPRKANNGTKCKGN